MGNLVHLVGCLVGTMPRTLSDTLMTGIACGHLRWLLAMRRQLQDPFGLLFVDSLADEHCALLWVLS